MNVKTIAVVCLMLIAYAPIIAQLPTTYLVKPERLASVKERFKKNDATAKAWVKAIVKDADKELNNSVFTVMQKSQTPPSGSKHDYMSLAPYFWPDPSKPNGLPYMRKDGERNPEIKSITDHKQIDDMVSAVKFLTLAYYFTDNEKYAAKATSVLHAWFIDTATLMNPNLNFAQAIKGENDGRGIGLIETVGLIQVVNGVGLLAGSKSWSSKDDAVLKTWFSTFLNWMQTSKNGIDEHNAKNNHGIWYDAQISAFSLFLGKQDFLKEYLSSTLKRIPVQIEPDGRQPLELERTTSLGYSTMCLEAWFTTATLAEQVKVNIWDYATPDGRSIKKALDWLLPYALGEKEWTYKQIHPYSQSKLYTLLLLAAEHYTNESYYQASLQIKEKADNVVTDVFYGR